MSETPREFQCLFLGKRYRCYGYLNTAGKPVVSLVHVYRPCTTRREPTPWKLPADHEEMYGAKYARRLAAHQLAAEPFNTFKAQKLRAKTPIYIPRGTYKRPQK